jgi:hypothetical protein
MECGFLPIVLQPRSRPGEEAYSPYDWDPVEQAEVTEICKTQSSVKPTAKPTTAAEMETDRSDLLTHLWVRLQNWPLRLLLLMTGEHNEA